MVSWDIALGLVLLAFAVPFFVLHYKEKRHRLYAQCKYAEASQLRRMLREAEEHIRRDQSLILEALGTPFLLMRPGGRVVMANSKACRLFGVESLDATNLLLSLPESEMREFLSRVVRATEKIRTKLQVPGEQGERVYRVTATPLATRARYIGIVFSDMTEEYRTQVVRRDFVANASHELRTPPHVNLGVFGNPAGRPRCLSGYGHASALFGHYETPCRPHDTPGERYEHALSHRNAGFCLS